MNTASLMSSLNNCCIVAVLDVYLTTDREGLAMSPSLV